MRLSSQSTAMSDPEDTSAERIFASICSPSALDRHAAATALSDLMEEKHSTEHHRRVGELISSAEANERAGGLAAIASLMLIDGDDLGPRLSTYGPPLRTALLRSASDFSSRARRALSSASRFAFACSSIFR